MTYNEKEGNSLILIPKVEQYIEYVLNMLVKLPRIEKFSIGNEYKLSMYKMLEETMMLNKVSISKMKEQKKFYVAMEYTYEIGKILGGLLKYYAKNNTTSYACLKNRGMHQACLDLQKAMLHCKYYLSID